MILTKQLAVLGILGLTTGLVNYGAPAPARAAETAQVVKITASKFHFTPDRVVLAKGQPVTLQLTSADRTHGFMVRAFGIDTDIEPGKYTVILEPSAVLDIVGFMFYDFGGLSVLDQRSFLNDRVGKQLFGENMTIHDDVRHPLQAGAAFDGEGVNRQRVTLVERGLVKSLVYARGTAERDCSTSLIMARTGDPVRVPLCDQRPFARCARRPRRSPSLPPSSPPGAAPRRPIGHGV